jgi:hypothetical protein
MIIGVLLSAGVVGVIVFALLLIFRKDLVGVDLGARSLLRMYLYLASLAAVMVFAIGVAATIDWGMARAFGGEAVYGRPPVVQLGPAGEKCIDPEQIRQQAAHERDRRQQEDLLRGATLAAFGAVFWGGHYMARRRLGDVRENASALPRAYNVLGTFVFGVGTVILLPVGIYQVLFVTLIAPAQDLYASGFGDSLSGGIVSGAFWLVFLLRVVGAVRGEQLAAPPKPLAAGG